VGYVWQLPKDVKQAEDVVANLVLQGKAKRNPISIKWWVANYYLQGLRQFSSFDYTNGTVSLAYLNEAGILKFRYDGIVAKYMSQLGRLLSLDLSPAVKTKNISLDGLRKASTGQVVLDNVITEDKVKKFSLNLMPPFLMYGTVGVGLWIEGPDSQGLEVIPPWELLPIPVDISGPQDVRGLMRIRYVPVEWIKRLAITPGGKSGIYNQVEEVKLPSGNMPVNLDSLGDGMVSYTSTGGGFFIQSSSKDSEGMWGKAKKPKNEKEVPVTGLAEIWTETSDGFLAEYGIYVGITKFKEFYRHDHTQSKYYMPVSVIRDGPVGSFWGNSYIDQLIPLNNEIELALSSMFQAVADFDLYGVQLWPSTLGTPPLALRGQDGIKRIVYEADYTCPEIKPENIEPAKMTGPQLQAIQLATQLMDKNANQPSEMMSGSAPGRVDSSAGLGFLYEVSGIPLSPSAKSIAVGVAGVYRALLRILKDTWSDQKVVNISNLDDSLAGIVLDAESGTLSLSQNAIPFPEEVSVTVASEVPISKEQQKAELKEAFKEGRITIDEFNWTVRKKGLDIPVGDEIGWQNYRRAMLENILLFGDGETPGKVIISENDLHRIHLMVLQAFVARPEFFVASVKVREAFNEHIAEHKVQMGEYPEQLSYPDESAEMMLQPPQGGMPMGNMPIQ
jgi:hypothetical protein